MVLTSFTLQERVRNLESLSNQKEKLFEMLKVYLELFPVSDAFLFRYSPLEHLGEGIIALSSSGLVHIGDIRDDIQTIPLIYAAIRDRKAKFSTGIEYFLKHSSCKFSGRFPINSSAVVPLCFGSVVIGYICTTQFEKGTIMMDDQMLSSLTLFGKLAGKVLDDSTIVEGSTSLISKRELEVMKRIARGESTKEMASYMGIGEVTVKQYVKSAINKLGAQNRAHAVAELFRRGIIKL
ncbi:response regulator transcription factor [Neobacillus cucumis]|uniref:response regulator transcription factor n=1 Tax=Neobacillus cucumis TaxID=1740721 RepID=UPI0019653F3E|nr:helix-turn-helix transcriptional regulator [Neobacillus cucumis]MBM7656440.1 DNA-binding CsgD family transcriptional regulator [Neobacillus cucumis]